jgi:hypothetical protein
MDPDLDLDPTPDPTSFFIDFKNAKKYLFSYFFLITCPQAHHRQSKKLKFLLNFCVRILFSRHYLNIFMRKGKDLDPDTYLWLKDPDPDPGGPKKCGPCGSGSGFPTLDPGGFQILHCDSKLHCTFWTFIRGG